MRKVLPAHRLTDAQRATEAAQILALGVMRWRAAQGSDARQENALSDSEYSGFPLDFLATKSVHATRYHQPENGA